MEDLQIAVPTPPSLVGVDKHCVNVRWVHGCELRQAHGLRLCPGVLFHQRLVRIDELGGGRLILPHPHAGRAGAGGRREAFEGPRLLGPVLVEERTELGQTGTVLALPVQLGDAVEEAEVDVRGLRQQALHLPST